MGAGEVELSGKTAIVTGAAGGVGRALSSALAREGVAVAMADLDQEALDEAGAAIGGKVRPAALDVSDHDAWRAYFEEVEADLGPVEFLCNVAGIMPISLFDEEDDVVTDRIVGVNLMGVIYGTKEAGIRMKPRGSGHIVNVASGAGWMAGAGAATYCASKFGVVGYSEAAHLELRGSGVDVSVVGPGHIRTQLGAGLKELRGMRSVEPEEVAETIVEVLRRPRFVVFVPKSVGAAAHVLALLPYAFKHLLGRVARLDGFLLEADQSARAEYEQRFGSAGEREKIKR